jgi:TetR/AcrR family fatty acid metabolism transcriptional regulator
MNEIVRASGLSKGAVYGHFPSKANLVIALQDRVLESRVQGTVLQFREGESARDRVLKLTRRLFEPGTASDRERARLTLQFTASALLSPELRAQVDARYKRVHGLFRDLLAEGKRSGEFRADLDTNATAALILGLLDGLRVDWAFTSQLKLDPKQLFPTVKRLLWTGILNRAESNASSRFGAPPSRRRNSAGPGSSDRVSRSESP